MNDLEKLEEVRVRYLGRKGIISSALKRIGELPPERRRDYGRKVNRLKELVEERIRERERELRKREVERKLSAEWVDLTVYRPGCRHQGNPSSCNPRARQHTA